MQSPTSTYNSLPYCPQCYYFPKIAILKNFEIEIRCCSVITKKASEYLKQLYIYIYINNAKSGLVPVGIEPTTLALLAPRSNQTEL